MAALLVEAALLQLDEMLSGCSHNPAHLASIPAPPPPPRRPRQANEAQLRAAFEPAGFVWELALPRSATGRGRGFAFVGFTQRAHAERAIKLVNGQAVAGRPVAVDWAVAKAQFGQQAGGEGGEGGGAPAPAPVPGMDSDLEGSSDDERAAPAGGRRLVSAAVVVAVAGGLLEGGGREGGSVACSPRTDLLLVLQASPLCPTFTTRNRPCLHTAGPRERR